MSTDLAVTGNISAGGSISGLSVSTSSITTTDLTTTNLSMNGNLNFTINNVSISGALNSNSISNTSTVTTNTLNSQYIKYGSGATDLQTTLNNITNLSYDSSGNLSTFNDNVKINNNLSVGTIANVESNLNTINTNITNLSYDSSGNLSTFNDNVKINNNLSVGTIANVESNLNTINTNITNLSYDSSGNVSTFNDNVKINNNLSLGLIPNVESNLNTINTNISNLTYDSSGNVSTFNDNLLIPSGFIFELGSIPNVESQIIKNNTDISNNLTSITNNSNSISTITGDITNISYTSGTTNINNNVSIPSGKILTLGSIPNVEAQLITNSNDVSNNTTAITTLQTNYSSINSSVTNNSNSISTINSRITDFNYNSSNDISYVNNNFIVYGKQSQTNPNDSFQVQDTAANQGFSIIPATLQGSYNSIVQNNDVLLLSKLLNAPNSAPAITISNWDNVYNHGVRIKNNNIVLGSSKTTISGSTNPQTNINIDGDLDNVSISNLNNINTNIQVLQNIISSPNFTSTLVQSGVNTKVASFQANKVAYKNISVSMPISFYKTFSYAGTTAFNITDTLSSLAITINKNGATYLSNLSATYSPPLLNLESYIAGSSTNGLITNFSYELFYSMVTFNFVINSGSSNDLYEIYFNPTITNVSISPTTGFSAVTNYIRTNTSYSLIENSINNYIIGVSASNYSALNYTFQDIGYTKNNDVIQSPNFSGYKILGSEIGFTGYDINSNILNSYEINNGLLVGNNSTSTPDYQNNALHIISQGGIGLLNSINNHIRAYIDTAFGDIYANRIFAQNFGIAGYYLNETSNTNGYDQYYPIVGSTKAIQQIADKVLVLPKYKFVLYSSTGYTGSTETHDNTTGTSAVCYLLTNRDTYQSVRVYYQANSFDIETEIVITNIS